MNKNLSRIKKDLKSFAKRVKDFKYTDKVLVMFLLTGTIGIENNLFSAQTTDTAIENQIKQINTSVHNFEQNLKKTKDKNNKSIKQSNLELIQLMEQGDHVIKSTWSNWQYATGENYNDWQGTYKGFGDKNEKYPYEGIFERSLNIYERFVSPSSENYNLLGRSKKLASATGMANGYGLTNINVATEPLIGFEVSAEINPRNINKPPITISDKTAITPTLPTPISFTPPKPIIKLPVLPNLPKPPSFNIKLGSFCNGMSGGCRSYGTDGGQYNYGTPNTIGIPRTYTVGTIFNLINSITLNDNNPSLTHGWASDFGGHSALFYAYFDVLNQRINGTALLNGNLTITSVNPVQSDASLSSYNKQKFLVGGSRIATLDNVRGGTLKNNATINLIGPLTIGFGVQSDRFFGNDAKTRTLENDGIITDEGEKNSIELDGLLAKGTGTTMLELAPGLGGPAKIKVSRTSEGFTGYKTGLIMTYEQDDTLSDSKYILKNNNIIKFTGEKSIGIQVFAPGSPSRVEVSNTNNSSITLGGIESYGMKWSSCVADNSTMDNSGTLKISGDAGTKLFPNGTAQMRDSLSSGIAVIEDSSSGSGSSAIRAYNGKVTNNGVINVSGGKWNTGMVLVVNAADDVTNTSNGTINVNSAAGRQNIAMRVDKGSVPTDAPGMPKAINSGNIYLDGDSSIGIVGTNADVTNTGNIETTTSKTIINGIGMATRGGVLENSGTINLKGSGVSSNIGVYMVKGTSNPSGTLASTSIIKVKGDDSTGALISNGTLNYGGNITAEGNGVSGLIIGDNASNTTNATITNNGLITVNNGTAAAGIYTYTDNSSGTPVTVKKGSYGIVVGKNSKLISDGTNNINVNIDVKGTESIGLYAGENAKLEVKDHTVNANDGAVNYDADKNATLTLKGTGTAHTGKKSLLFYLGENGTGKISLGNTMNVTIEGGTTPAERGNAFYYVGNGTTFGATEISNWAKNNFGDGKTSTLGNLNLTMNAGSRLFIAQNTGMNLSDTTGVTISSATGANIIGTDYKTFMLYLSKLTINQDVDLNNTTDGYNHLEIANSSITNAANKTMTGIQANDVAMAQENNKSLYARNKVTLANEGNINLSGTTSAGIYAKFGELHNRATGVITIANKSTAMYGIGDSLLENAGKITVGTNSIAMYSEGSTTQAMKNNGTIELPQTDSVAMSYKPDSTLSSGTVLENAGNIQLTGDKNTAIYAAGTPTYTAKNSGTITLTNSATINNPNVGLLRYQ
ncbi:autotransporter-associated N-terminal domain-containing protein [Leptotrichia wadei]|uniref:autotransporter-associated N-terminal domain-containing protein n=1 Tax=Leptotrichia wadei TaxID=157687 RepID=UPI0028D2FA19|nr:autotransporter-associated N-terminal domain-containing protein [Leptotrichia wadei]